MSHIKFRVDEEDEDDITESEDEYSEKEKALLNKARQSRKSKNSDDEDGVYNIVSEEESDESDIALSDIDGQDDDDLPNIRAWGKDKRSYYSTDYVDPDYGGYQDKDAALADLEEEEARNLHLQLAQQLDDNDFSLEDFGKKVESLASKELEENVIKTDVSQLSARQKLQLLQKESPEFFNLVDDFKAKILIIKDYLKPICDMSKSEKIVDSEALNFVKIFHQLILNYCTNIYMYLLLKTSKVNIQSHPVIKRLYQYRQLLAKLEQIFLDIIKPQIVLILEQNESSKEKCTKMLKFLRNIANTKVNYISEKSSERKSQESNSEKVLDIKQTESSSDEEAEVINNVQDKEENEMQTDETDGKRAITYQIAKNKGLMPQRKKEQRNPRVKHRNKFRKAKIRRKGAIREVRKELQRYGGEISGIKATVTKSIKIKS